MTDYLYVPTILTYLLVSLAISAGLRPAEPWRLWQATVLAGAAAALAVERGSWVAAAIWTYVVWLHFGELSWAYRVELYRRA